MRSIILALVLALAIASPASARHTGDSLAHAGDTIKLFFKKDIPVFFASIIPTFFTEDIPENFCHPMADGFRSLPARFKADQLAHAYEFGSAVERHRVYFLNFGINTRAFFRNIGYSFSLLGTGEEFHTAPLPLVVAAVVVAPTPVVEKEEEDTGPYISAPATPMPEPTPEADEPIKRYNCELIDPLSE
jgi:hypothetical protein